MQVKWFRAKMDDSRQPQLQAPNPAADDTEHVRRVSTIGRSHAARSGSQTSLVPSAAAQANERSLRGSLTSSQRLAANVRQLSESVAVARQRQGNQDQLDEARKTYDSNSNSDSYSNSNSYAATTGSSSHRKPRTSASRPDLESARSSY
jgi:hypothetical protein